MGGGEHSLLELCTLGRADTAGSLPHMSQVGHLPGERWQGGTRSARLDGEARVTCVFHLSLSKVLGFIDSRKFFDINNCHKIGFENDLTFIYYDKQKCILV